MDKFNEAEVSVSKRDALLIKKSSIKLAPSISSSFASKEDDIMKEELVTTIDYFNIKADNIFEILTAKNNIDILCIKAKNAYSNYDILKAYDLCIK